MKLSSSLLEQITEGKTFGEFTVQAYSIDSRNISKGDMFICMRGTTDGHQYIHEAITKGCGSLMIDETFILNNDIDFPYTLVVQDTFVALNNIAKYNRSKFTNAVVGITGSVGKTTLKEMLSFILQRSAMQESKTVSKTFGNFNNHIGLPFSLAHMDENASFGVYEMGMSASGEISVLSKLLRPTVAVITDISSAHSEFFNSIDDIAKAKLEILDGVQEGAVLFLNKDNKYFDFCFDFAREKGIKNIITCSYEDYTADIWIEKIVIDGYSSVISAYIFKKNIAITLQSLAIHNALLAVMAFGIAKYLGCDIKKIVPQFSNFTIPKGRGSIEHIVVNNKHIVLIDDSYNANPTSMQSALSSLNRIPNNNKIIVLGDMLELGEIEIVEHEKLRDTLKNINKKLLITVGSRMKVLNTNTGCKNFDNYKEAYTYLQQELKDGDIIFIKGSYGSGVHNISNCLQK